MTSPKTLRALFSRPGFLASSRLKGVFGDRFARVVVLRRRKKQLGAHAAAIVAEAAMTSAPFVSAIFVPATGVSTSSSSAGACGALGAARCL
jgi:hypothetical protein